MDQHLSCIIKISALTIIIIIIIIIMAKTLPKKKNRFFRHLVLYSSSLTKTVNINELSLLVPLKSS